MTTALPAATDWTGASITEAQFKTAMTDLRTYLADQLGTTGSVATALATLGALGSAWVSKTGAYTVATTDRGKLIGCSGTFTLSLTAAATLADGFSFAVLNYGSGTITIDPNSSEQIDGSTTLDLAAGESCIVVCTGGTAFRTIGRAVSDGQFQSTQVFTASGTWNKPAGLKRVKVTVVGGGGGGAYGGFGAGGGGGGMSVMTIEAASLSSSETVTVGAGGAGGASSGASTGSAGGTTSFGSHCQATGGSGGVKGSTVGGAGGVGSLGGINQPGSSGGGQQGGIVGGFGGASPIGGGAAGAASGSGNAATANSGGGGGGAYSASAGGAGAAGIVIVEEFF